jgi:hypothetical protein
MRRVILGGLILGLAFLIVISVDGLTHAEAFGDLLIGAVLGYFVWKVRGLLVFIVALTMVTIAWGVQAGAFGQWG